MCGLGIVEVGSSLAKYRQPHRLLEEELFPTDTNSLSPHFALALISGAVARGLILSQSP